jgi:hypothetical protein
VNWVVDVAISAQQAYRELDAAMQAELREQVARLAEDPPAHLSRSARLPGRMTYAYRSTVADRVTVTLVFAELDLEAQRLLLLVIGHVSEPEVD